MDSFRAATGRPPRNPGKALAIEHRKAVEANRRKIVKHRSRSKTYRSRATAGAVVAGVTGAVGVIDVVAETAGSSGGLPGPPWMWFTFTAVGILVSWRARRRLSRLGPEPEVIEPVAPPPALARGRTGSIEVSRLTSARAQMMKVAPAVERMYPGAGVELARADHEASGVLTELAERLVVLDQLQRELPGTSAALAATQAGELVRQRLDEGCDTYDDLLAAAARLLAAPDLSRPTAEILNPAIDAMVAYAHGLQRASDASGS